MAVDYYSVLKVNKTATEEEVKRAYKKQAMRWHPDKNINLEEAKRKEAESKFKLISRAYDVLTDPRKRWVYDKYGDEEFSEGSFGNGNNSDDVKSNGKGKTTSNMEETVESRLVCSLEELYLGARRKMRISRSVPNDFGKPMTIEEILKIDIMPGWKKGTKIIFPEKGNSEPGGAPADLIFVVDEKPHSVFKREGNDLVIREKVSLAEALTGKTISLTTLDGRYLTIPVLDVIGPGYEVVVKNEGMPISKEPGRKGKLRIKFDVLFPSRLSEDQKSELKKVLVGN